MKSVLLICYILISCSASHAQWFWIKPLPQGNRLQSVHFINNNVGFAVGYRGVILKTTNGGVSWEFQTTIATNDLSSVYFVNNDTF